MLTKTPIPIEEELRSLCNQHGLANEEGLENYKGRDLKLARLAKTAGELDDSIFQKMTPELQNWLNAASTAVMEKQSIVDFNGGINTEIGTDLPIGLIKLYNSRAGSYRRNYHYLAGFRLMCNHKMGNTAIAEKLKVNLTTVSGWRKRWTDLGFLTTNSERNTRDRRKRPEKDAAIKMFQVGHDIPQVRTVFPNVPHSSIKAWKLQSGPIKEAELTTEEPLPECSPNLKAKLKIMNTWQGARAEVLISISKHFQTIIINHPDWKAMSPHFPSTLKAQVILTWACEVTSD